MAEDITKVLARNLKALMEDRDPPWSQKALGAKSKVGQTSIGLMLNPEKRAPLKSGKLPSPTIAQVEAVAKVLGKEAWQLLHPNPGQAPLSASERRRYEQFETAMKVLQQPPEPPEPA